MKDSSWGKPNHYIVRDGKIIPKSDAPSTSPNYRYVPFDPVNRPGPHDYFRSTINRMQ